MVKSWLPKAQNLSWCLFLEVDEWKWLSSAIVPCESPPRAICPERQFEGWELRWLSGRLIEFKCLPFKIESLSAQNVQRPMLSSMLQRPFNPSQPAYPLNLGGQYSYPGLTAQGQIQAQSQMQAPIPNTTAAISQHEASQATNVGQAAPNSMQMFLRPQMSQPGFSQQTGLQALSANRPGVRPGNSPQTTAPQVTNLRPGQTPNQQSVASQLLSQQPIASHAMATKVNLFLCAEPNSTSTSGSKLVFLTLHQVQHQIRSSLILRVWSGNGFIVRIDLCCIYSLVGALRVFPSHSCAISILAKLQSNKCCQ